MTSQSDAIRKVNRRVDELQEYVLRSLRDRVVGELSGTLQSLQSIVNDGLEAVGHIYGLILSNNSSDATNDIDIAGGRARSDDNTYTMVLGSALTKRLDANWAVGTGNGGRDTGSIANATWHVWLIARSDTGVVDALFSQSATAPTVPANYDKKRRIGSIRRVGGSIYSFSQTGDEFLLSPPVFDMEASNPGTGAQTVVLSVPSGIKVKVIGSVVIDAPQGDGTALLLSALDVANAAPSTTGLSTIRGRAQGTDQYANSTFYMMRTSTSGAIRYRLSTSTSNITVRFHTYGWIDARGRLV